MTLAFRRDFNHTFHRAFDDCAVTESIFKLLHIFGNLVQRNLIALELSDKMPLLIVTLEKEMDDARKIFMKQQVALRSHFWFLSIRIHLQCKIVESGKPRTERNMPLVAGQLKFAKEVCSGLTFSCDGTQLCFHGTSDLCLHLYFR